MNLNHAQNLRDPSQDFDSLFSYYSRDKSFNYYEITGQSRSELQNAFSMDGPGVYLIWKTSKEIPIYIGSAGKIGKEMKTGKSTVKKRMFQATTPYHFNRKEALLHFSPSDSKVLPSKYNRSVPINELLVGIFICPDHTIPASLEYLFLQGFINQFRDLPQINQKA